MVFPSYESVVDEFNTLRSNRIRNEMEQENNIMRDALISKQRLKNNLPKLEQTKLSNGQTERILSEINTFLHGLMSADDAREAYKYLVEADLLDSFYDQIGRFRKYFEGVKRITYAQFVNYFDQLSSRTGLFLEQQTQADRPLQDKADQFTREIAGLLESKEMKAKQEVQSNPKGLLKDAFNVLKKANETIQAIRDIEDIKGRVTKINNLIPDVNAIRDFIRDRMRVTPETGFLGFLKVKDGEYDIKKPKLINQAIEWRDELQILTDKLEVSEIEGRINEEESRQMRQAKAEEMKKRSRAHSEGIKSFYTRSHASVRVRPSSEQQLTNQLKVLLGELSVGNHAVISDIRKLISTMHDSGMVSDHEYATLTQKLANA